jgi:arylsulfatase A-like enzyme
LEKDIAPYRKLYKKNDRKELMQARLEKLIDSGLIPKQTKLHESMVNPKKDVAATELPLERMAIHAAMVESIDRSLADTIKALKKAGKLDNTLILVLSDNGASSQLCFNRKAQTGVRPGSADTFLNHGAALAALSNTPFRNYKTSNYEGGIASPLVAWWPKGIKDKGRISHRLSNIADIMPTCLELANVSYPSKFDGRKITPLAGKSFVSVLRAHDSDKDRHRVLAWPRAVRQGDWKLVMDKRDRPELYHIGRDRNETQNLADKYIERVKSMQKIHAELYQGRN